MVSIVLREGAFSLVLVSVSSKRTDLTNVVDSEFQEVLGGSFLLGIFLSIFQERKRK